MKNNKLSISFSMFLASFSLGIAQEEAPELDALKVTATPFDKSSEDLAQPWYVIAEEELNRLMQATLGETLGWKPGVSSTSLTAEPAVRLFAVMAVIVSVFFLTDLVLRIFPLHPRSYHY